MAQLVVRLESEKRLSCFPSFFRR